MEKEYEILFTEDELTYLSGVVFEINKSGEQMLKYVIGKQKEEFSKGLNKSKSVYSKLSSKLTEIRNEEMCD